MFALNEFHKIPAQSPEKPLSCIFDFSINIVHQNDIDLIQIMFQLMAKHNQICVPSRLVGAVNLQNAKPLIESLQDW